MSGEADPCVLVIFGASGDLTSRKIIPALYDLSVGAELPAGLSVLGVSRTAMTDDGWRDRLAPWVKEHARRYDPAAWDAFARRIHYFAGSASQPETYLKLGERIAELSDQHGGRGRILFYLAVAPSLYVPIVECLDQSGLILEGRRWCSLDRDVMPWQRIIVEKPFGHDVASAQSLNRALGRVA